MSPLDQTWLVIENPSAPGEVVTLSAGAVKYALAFIDPVRAAAFLAGMDDAADLRVGSLESWVLKEAFLAAARVLGATHVLFDYEPGSHSAQAAPIERVADFLRSRAVGGNN
ncbi:MAG TPA: DUF3234 domain-containing protein [Deinococcales bacterium]|nr:DUF3234 domain-containing protein [Deinococcales bacterium]